VKKEGRRIVKKKTEVKQMKTIKSKTRGLKETN